MAGWKHVEGRVSVEMSVDLGKQFEAAVDRLIPSLGPDMRAATAEMATSAKSKWPVGRDDARPPSRDLIRSEQSTSAGNVSSSVVSPAPYTVYIRAVEGGKELKVQHAAARAAVRPQRGPGGVFVPNQPLASLKASQREEYAALPRWSPWQTLIRKPSKEVTARLVKALAKDVVEAFTGAKGA